MTVDRITSKVTMLTASLILGCAACASTTTGGAPSPQSSLPASAQVSAPVSTQVSPQESASHPAEPATPTAPPGSASTPAQGSPAGGAASVPPDAAKAVSDVVSQDPAAVRSALAGSLAQLTPDGALAPNGTRIDVQPGSWQQTGDFATLTAVVTVPQQAPVTVLFHLVKEEGRWRVLMTEPR